MGFKAGSYWSAIFYTEDPLTGAARNADAGYPILSWARDLVPDGRVPPTLTVTNPVVGQYNVSGLVPQDYPGGAGVQVSAEVKVGGIDSSRVIDSFILDEDLVGNIASAAAGPRSVTSDGHTVEQQPLPDLIAADQYLHAKAAAAKKGRGLRFTKLIGPPQTPVQGTSQSQDPSFGTFGSFG